MTLNRLLLWRDVVSEPVSRDPCELSLYGVDVVERQFADQVYSNATSLIYPYSQGANALSGPSTSNFTFSAGGTSVGAPVGVICISGLPTGQGVHVELIQHIELSGYRVQAFFTPNSAHSEDIDKVNTIVAQIPAVKESHPESKIWDVVKMAASYAGKAVATYALPAAEKALLGMLAL
jgi:hypothetical protein